MNKQFIFVLNNQDEFETPFDVKLLNKLGNAISQKIVSEKYYVQSQVSRESFQTFLDYLNDRKSNPELTVNNYYEFLLLSEEFNGNLREYLSKEEFEKIKFLSILKNAKAEEKRDQKFCEEYISSNLDYFLEFYSKEMSEIKTTTLYNIFEHEKRKLKNHERAYQFINNLIKSGKDSSCILLKTLDGLLMSEKSINESFDNKNENFGFVPEFNQSFISEIKNQMNDILKQQSQMMNAIKSLLNEKISSIQDNYELLTQKIEASNEKIQNLSQKINESNDKIDKIILENEETKNNVGNISEKVGNIENELKKKISNDEKVENKVDKIISENQKINDKIDNISQTINESNEKIEEIITENQKTNEKIENISQIINESNEKIENISQIINESNEKIENISQKIDETIPKIDENSKVINDIKEQVDLIKRKCSEIETKCDKINDCILRNEKSNKKNFDTIFGYLKISINAYNGQFDGIIKDLTNECGGNVSDKGVVNVTTSSIQWGNPRDVVNLENTRTFGTKKLPDSWIKYDFKNLKVFPVCYLIRTCGWSKDINHPKSWVVEGSNTDSLNDWKVLDSRKECMSLNNPNVVQCFAIQQSSDFYRFLRIRQTDKNASGNYYFTLSALEYFGFIQ